MPTPSQEELDTRAFKANWCEHCRCQVLYANMTDTGNHKRCGKATEHIPVVVVPVRDFSAH